MNRTDEYLTLEGAVAWALAEKGEGVLSRPQVLLGFLMDAMDPGSPEMFILERNCDGELLRPYRDALGGAFDLALARAKAEECLIRQRRIGAPDARLVARGIADGVARWAGRPRTHGCSPADGKRIGVSDPRVTWDCVWLGSYPQVFVTDAATVAALDAATGWSASGDLDYGGAAYRRLREADATHSGTSPGCWNWGQASPAGYCYFLWEPIKWRVLEADGSTALVVADIALDDQPYNDVFTAVAWEDCALRAWLDWTFWNDALTSAQQGAVMSEESANDDNTYYGTPGGSATTDNVFLLAESDVWSTDAAARHGFVGAGVIYDEARQCKPSDYARAMGSWSSVSNSLMGNCYWWLQSPGRYAYYAAFVSYDGYVDLFGYDVDGADGAVRPALRIALSSDQVSYAGTVCSDGTVDEVAPDGPGR